MKISLENVKSSTEWFVCLFSYLVFREEAFIRWLPVNFTKVTMSSGELPFSSDIAGGYSHRVPSITSFFPMFFQRDRGDDWRIKKIEKPCVSPCTPSAWSLRSKIFNQPFGTPGYKIISKIISDWARRGYKDARAVLLFSSAGSPQYHLRDMKREAVHPN